MQECINYDDCSDHHTMHTAYYIHATERVFGLLWEIFAGLARDKTRCVLCYFFITTSASKNWVGEGRKKVEHKNK